MSDFRVFRAEVKKQLVLRGWRHKDLAKATGYSVNAIDTFMTGSRCSVRLENAIRAALDIKMLPDGAEFEKQ